MDLWGEAVEQGGEAFAAADPQPQVRQLDAALLTARSGILHTQRALAASSNDVANAETFLRGAPVASGTELA